MNAFIHLFIGNNLLQTSPMRIYWKRSIYILSSISHKLLKCQWSVITFELYFWEMISWWGNVYGSNIKRHLSFYLCHYQFQHTKPLSVNANPFTIETSPVVLNVADFLLTCEASGDLWDHTRTETFLLQWGVHWSEDCGPWSTQCIYNVSENVGRLNEHLFGEDTPNRCLNGHLSEGRETYSTPQKSRWTTQYMPKDLHHWAKSNLVSKPALCLCLFVSTSQGNFKCLTFPILKCKSSIVQSAAISESCCIHRHTALAHFLLKKNRTDGVLKVRFKGSNVWWLL